MPKYRVSGWLDSPNISLVVEAENIDAAEGVAQQLPASYLTAQTLEDLDLQVDMVEELSS